MAMLPECHPCLERLVGLAVELATPDPEVRRQALKSARRCLDQEFGPGAIPAGIANRFLGIIHQISGNHDPFAARKAAATVWAARMFQRLAPAYGDDLESLLRLAAVGNAIDFFRGEAEVTRELLARVEFEIGGGARLSPPNWPALPASSSTWRTTPGSSSSIAPWCPRLRRRGWRVVYVVKAGPIQNDLTLADLYGLGSGSGPGAGGGHRGPHRGVGA